MIDDLVHELAHEFTALDNAWQDTLSQWQDDTSVRFEHDVIEPALALRSALLRSGEDLADAIRQAIGGL